MDSMNGLQGSLPLSSTRRTALLQPFRETAYSLTAFFKTASAEVDRAFADGARSALEQLLAGMDRENLGLQEGEGWRVRQMVMELYQGLQTDEGEERNVSASPEPEPEEEGDKVSVVSSPVRQHESRMAVPAKITKTSRQQPIIEEEEEVKCPPVDLTMTQNPQPLSFKHASAHASPLFDSFVGSKSPSDQVQYPMMLPTQINFSDAQAMTFFGALKSKNNPVLGPGAGTKRRSKSPTESSNNNAAPAAKRSRRNAMEH